MKKLTLPKSFFLSESKPKPPTFAYTSRPAGGPAPPPGCDPICLRVRYSHLTRGPYPTHERPHKKVGAKITPSKITAKNKSGRRYLWQGRRRIAPSTTVEHIAHNTMRCADVHIAHNTVRCADVRPCDTKPHFREEPKMTTQVGWVGGPCRRLRFTLRKKL